MYITEDAYRSFPPDENEESVSVIDYINGIILVALGIVLAILTLVLRRIERRENTGPEIDEIADT